MATLEDICQTLVSIEENKSTLNNEGDEVTVTTSSTKVLDSNTSRTFAYFVNTGSEDINLCLFNPAIVDTGITLFAYGGWYEINSTNMYRGEIYAIVSGGTSTLSVTEGVRVPHGSKRTTA